MQTWLPRDLAAQVKAEAAIERRSVSQLIRCAIEDKLRRDVEPERRNG